MEHVAVTDEIQKKASLSAAGALPPKEEREFREHLKSCRVCAEELRAFLEAASCRPLALETAAPPQGLRARLLARIQGELPPGISVVRAAEGEWQPLGVPGVTAKTLSVQPDGNVAMLVRMTAGAAYPPHRHADLEHCYVVEGDLHFGDLVLHAGDYECALASSNHPVSHTENGCMVLIIASQRNTMLPWTR
jgi:anti-sigma factor ChrR (cupin superfamily)